MFVADALRDQPGLVVGIAVMVAIVTIVVVKALQTVFGKFIKK